MIGHGVDLVEISDIGRWIDDPRNPLLPRCFIEEELKEIGDGPGRIKRLAGRFAAKEAVLKALGSGLGSGVALSDIIIHRALGEPPQVRLEGGAAKAAAEQHISTWKLSISHTKTIAIASAIAIGENSQGNDA